MSTHTFLFLPYFTGVKFYGLPKRIIPIPLFYSRAFSLLPSCPHKERGINGKRCIAPPARDPTHFFALDE